MTTVLAFTLSILGALVGIAIIGLALGVGFWLAREIVDGWTEEDERTESNTL